MKLTMRSLVFEFSRVTEQGALAAYNFLGRNNKDAADDAAVQSIRYMLNKLPISGEVVIGEGEMDEAPMLYIGEKVGSGGFEVDIALDPIDGTSMVSKGQYNSLSVVAAAEKGSLLNAPDMYMEKLCVGQAAKGSIDLNKDFETNIRNIAKAYKKDLKDLTVALLERERHRKHIELLYKLGCKVYLFDNGDISPSLQTCDFDSDIDVMYGTGGAPEGVLTAVAIKALGGDMQGRLVHYSSCYPEDHDAKERDAQEQKRCKEMNIEVSKIFKLNDMVKGDEICFSATGISKGDLLEGVTRTGDYATTETLLIRGKTQTIRKIKSTHFLNKKDDFLIDIFYDKKK